MSDKTGIQWTDATWNPVIGCAKVSAGCKNCYAEKQGYRISKMNPKSGYLDVINSDTKRWGGNAKFMPERLDQPLRWRKPRTIFVNSMSDLFHEDVTFEQIAAVFGVMAATPRHIYQVLTKRPQRMREFFEWVDAWKQMDGRRCPRAGVCLSIARDTGADVFVDMTSDLWPLPNVHLGVSVEDQQRADERIPLLLKCPAVLRFLSVEPLLGNVTITRWMWPTHWVWAAAFESPDEAIAAGAFAEQRRQALVSGHARFIDWVIIGGESGPGARECDVAWIRSIVQECKASSVPVFVKQLGAVAIHGEFLETVGGPVDFRYTFKSRKGSDPSEWPSDLRVQEKP